MFFVICGGGRMNSLLSTSLLAVVLLLSACGGGSSDSSGSRAMNDMKKQSEEFFKNSYEKSYVNYPDCQIDQSKGIIYVGRNYGNGNKAPTNPLTKELDKFPQFKKRQLNAIVPQECKVKLPNLNGGLTFSLKCHTNLSTNNLPYIYIKGESRHMGELKNMIKTGKPYLVSCLK